MQYNVRAQVATSPGGPDGVSPRSFLSGFDGLLCGFGLSFPRQPLGSQPLAIGMKSLLRLFVISQRFDRIGSSLRITFATLLGGELLARVGKILRHRGDNVSRVIWFQDGTAALQAKARRDVRCRTIACGRSKRDAEHF